MFISENIKFCSEKYENCDNYFARVKKGWHFCNVMRILDIMYINIAADTLVKAATCVLFDITRLYTGYNEKEALVHYFQI